MDDGVVNMGVMHVTGIGLIKPLDQTGLPLDVEIGELVRIGTYKPAVGVYWGQYGQTIRVKLFDDYPNTIEFDPSLVRIEVLRGEALARFQDEILLESLADEPVGTWLDLNNM